MLQDVTVGVTLAHTYVRTLWYGSGLVSRENSAQRVLAVTLQTAVRTYGVTGRTAVRMRVGGVRPVAWVQFLRGRPTSQSIGNGFPVQSSDTHTHWATQDLQPARRWKLTGCNTSTVKRQLERRDGNL